MALFQRQILLYRCSHHKELIFGSALRGGFLSYKDTLFTHGQLVVFQDSQILSWEADFHLFLPQRVLVDGAIPPQEKNFFSFVELHKILFNQLVQAPLTDSKTIWCIS